MMQHCIKFSNFKHKNVNLYAYCIPKTWLKNLVIGNQFLTSDLSIHCTFNICQNVTWNLDKNNNLIYSQEKNQHVQYLGYYMQPNPSEARVKPIEYKYKPCVKMSNFGC